MITSYRLVDDNNKNTYYYTYDVLDANYDIITTDEDYDESSPYMQKFIEAGVTIYTHEEIKEILDKKAAEIGFNDGSSDSASYGDGKFSEVSVDHIGEDIPSVEEQTDKTALVAYNGVEGDITSYIDGYKESSLDGKLRVLRYTNGDGESCYSVGVGVSNTLELNMKNADVNTYEYYQVKDIDNDGSEELLIVSYGDSTALPYVVSLFVISFSGEESEVILDNQGVDEFQALNSELDGAHVGYVSLDDNGVIVVFDKGVKDSGVYYPDCYKMILSRG